MRGMTSRVAAATLSVVLGVAPGTVGAQDAGRATSAQKPRPPLQQPAPAERELPAQETRAHLLRIFQQYPPTLPQVLRLDPTLLGNQDYLGMYPTLAAFAAQHPEIAHNPAFFLDGLDRLGPVLYGPAAYNDRSRVINAVETVLQGTLFLIGFCFVIGLMASGIKSLVDHRRWLRISKTQTDAHSKLLDRLTSNEDLLAYIQSPAGRQFLEAAPLPSQTKPPAISAPINRILWSVQVGVILMLTGVGLWASKGLVIWEVAQPLSVMGVLSGFVGLGFALSALLSYVISKALGLFEAPAIHPHA